MKITRDLSYQSKTLASDGRLTIRLTPSELLELTLLSDSESLIIPSHIWTPWYGLLGSRSGYNSLEECFREKTSLIRAVETGLSSDPEMCMRIPELRNVAAVSFSDAHSRQNLGREVTYFDGDISFPALRSQVINNQVKKTIEYFPE